MTFKDLGNDTLMRHAVSVSLNTDLCQLSPRIEVCHLWVTKFLAVFLQSCQFTAMGRATKITDMVTLGKSCKGPNLVLLKVKCLRHNSTGFCEQVSLCS